MRIILKKELFQTPNVSWDNEDELPRIVVGVLRGFVRLMAMRFRRRSVLDREKLKERTGPGRDRRTMGGKLVRQRVVHCIRVT
jgi:hypothetical protein